MDSFKLEHRIRAIRRLAGNCRCSEEAQLILQLAEFYERQIVALRNSRYRLRLLH